MKSTLSQIFLVLVIGVGIMVGVSAPASAEGKDTISDEFLEAFQELCIENPEAKECQPSTSPLDGGICVGQCNEDGELVDGDGNVIGGSFWVDAECDETDKDEDGKCPFVAPSFDADTSALGTQLVKDVLGYLKWFAGIAGVGGLLLVAIMFMIGRRNRSQTAAGALSALPWIAVGLVLVGMSSAVAQWVIDLSQVAGP